MTNLRRMAVVAVLAAFASTATAQDQAAPAGGGGGWDSKYGMLFDLQNVFQNSSSSTIGGYEGPYAGAGLGLQMNLAPQSAIRMVVGLSRGSNPPYEETTLTGTAEVVPNPTSTYGVKIGAAYMMRLTTASIAPYAGVGASIGFEQASRAGDAHAAGSTVITTYDDTERTFGLGLDGTLGLEWRVHKSLAIFAEYVLDIRAIEKTSGDYNTKTGGTVTVDTKWSQTRIFNYGTGVGQTGQIGVLAFF